MRQSFFCSLHFYWVFLAVVNLGIQVAFFYDDRNNGLFIAKKITTPLLLFFALFIVVLESGGFPLVPCAILAAMGIGEFGMEGSNVVQTKMDDEGGPGETPLSVILAGVLFLLVNLFIGGTLMVKCGRIPVILVSLGISGAVISLLFSVVFKRFQPPQETKNQMMLYSACIIVLFAGALSDIVGGISTLGVAAVILTVSDSLVLVRMGADFRKNTVSGFRTLFAFLVGILLLYYVYMGVLIHIKSPFTQLF